MVIVNITLAILTKNSECFLNNVYRDLKQFSDVLVIDDYSNDNTKAICDKYGFRYYKRNLNDDFSSQRNYALTKAKYDWVFFIDSDEYINKKFIYELDSLLRNGQYDGLFIKRRSYFLDNYMHGTEMSSMLMLRCAKKNSGIWKRKVHEYWDIDGNLGTVSTEVIHKVTSTISYFIDKINKYFPIHAIENMKSGKKTSIVKILCMPFAKYFYNYFYLRGFLDREYGFVVSIFMSFHTFLSWSEFWLKNRSFTHKE